MNSFKGLYLIFYTIFSTLLYIGCSTQSACADKTIKNLKIIVLIFRAEDADFFNKVLRPEDIVASYVGHARLLKHIHNPKTLLVSPSIPKLTDTLKQLVGTHIDYINYNPELWITHDTPQEELQDIVGAVKKIREICRRRGASLSFTPDKGILEQHGKAVAPLVDMFGIQIQRYQRRTDKEFYDIVKNLVVIVRSANPQIPIILQVSTAPPIWKEGRIVRNEEGEKLLKPMKAEEILRELELVKDFADGIAIVVLI